MTINAIAKEIDKRIKQLNEMYEECYHDMIACKVKGDSEGEDKAIEKRRKISVELNKLRAMRTARL